MQADSEAHARKLIRKHLGCDRLPAGSSVSLITGEDRARQEREKETEQRRRKVIEDVPIGKPGTEHLTLYLWRDEETSDVRYATSDPKRWFVRGTLSESGEGLIDLHKQMELLLPKAETKIKKGSEP